jgi:hypothetical protein
MLKGIAIFVAGITVALIGVWFAAELLLARLLGI